MTNDKPFSEKISTKKKILIGGLGALTAPILSLVNVESQILENATALNLIGIIVRISALFYLGALVVWLHTDEHSPVKIFELGIAAPALLSLLVAGQMPSHAPDVTQNHNPALHSENLTLDLSFVASAFAAERAPSISTHEGKMPATSSPSTIQHRLMEIYDGITGRYGKVSANKPTPQKKESVNIEAKEEREAHSRK